jgi:hypothetical protein
MPRRFRPWYGNPNEQQPGELSQESARCATRAQESLETACSYLAQLYYCCIVDHNRQMACQVERKLMALSSVAGTSVVRQIVFNELTPLRPPIFDYWLERITHKLDAAETVEVTLQLPPDAAAPCLM